MKQFWIDLCCVLLLICVMSLFFGDHQVSRTLFERQIDQFEEDVSSLMALSIFIVPIWLSIK